MFNNAISRCLLLFFLVSFLSLASALHEDEQGKFDWMLRLLGNVEFFSFTSEKEGSKGVYLATSEGNVGLVPFLGPQAGQVAQRYMGVDRPRCITSSSRYVLLTTDNGAVLFLKKSSLDPVKTVLLELEGTPTLGEVSCTLANETMIIGRAVGGSVKLYRIDTNSNFEGTISPQTVKMSEQVQRVSLNSKYFAVNQTGNCKIYVLETLQLLKSVEGTCDDLKESTLFTSRTNRVTVNYFGSEPKGSEERSWTCDKCFFHFLENRKSKIASSFMLPNGLMVSFFSHRILLKDFKEGSKVLGIVQGETKNLFILVKSHLGNILLITEQGKPLWERPEFLAHPTSITFVEVADSVDHFHFKKEIIALTRSGMLVALPVDQHGGFFKVLGSVNDELLPLLGAKQFQDVVVQFVKAEAPGVLRMRCRFQGVHVDAFIVLSSGHIKVKASYTGALIATTNFVVHQDLRIEPPQDESKNRLGFSINVTSGLLSGFAIKGSHAIPTWSVQLSSPIASHAVADPKYTVVHNNLRLYPNSTKEETIFEVRHLYPMDSTIAVAHYEMDGSAIPTLVVTALDAVTGSIHGVARHANVAGDVKMTIAENAILYYFLDAEKMRYCFGVWELFQVEEGSVFNKNSVAPPPSIIASFFAKNDAVFSSRTSLPPVIKVHTLGVYGGPIAALQVTASLQSIARKNVILAFQSGRVGLVELNALLKGRSVFFKDEPEAETKQRELTNIIIPPTMYPSHRYRVAYPQHLSVSPTGLESSSHIAVAGLDFFYVRYSSGKAFDLLNSDFNKSLLLVLVGCIAISVLVSRYFLQRKTLSAAWA